MAITEQQESRALAARAARRQDKAQPWLIRTTDGAIFPNVPLLRAKPTMRVFVGDINAPVEERLRSLAIGGHQTRRVVFDEPEPFNITKASKEELIAFALDEYSEVIDADEHMNKVRAIVCSLASLDYNEVFGGAAAGGAEGAKAGGRARKTEGLQQPGAGA